MEQGVEVNEQLLEATKEQVISELENTARKVAEAHGNNWNKLDQEDKDEYFYGSFTNFLDNIPNSNSPQGRDGAKSESYRPGYLDVTNRANLERIYQETKPKVKIAGMDWDEEQAKGMAEYTTLYLDQTPREFFATVDAVLVKEGLDLGEIARLQAELEKPGNFRANIEFRKKMLPVYIRLRALGYNSHDLRVHSV